MRIAETPKMQSVCLYVRFAKPLDPQTFLMVLLESWVSTGQMWMKKTQEGKICVPSLRLSIVPL